MKLVQILGTELEICFPSCLSQLQIEFCGTCHLLYRQCILIWCIECTWSPHCAHPATPKILDFSIYFSASFPLSSFVKKQTPNCCFHLPHWSVFANNQPIRAENNDIKVSFPKNGKWIYGLVIFFKNCYILKITLGRLEFIVCKYSFCTKI